MTTQAEREVTRAIARLQAGILALVFGATGGIGLFVMTVWLVIRSGPKMGEHLGLLRHYFPGYSVSWPGAFVGLFWGALAGALVGWVIGWIYNRVVGLRR
ncbi:MAG: hypothetical protein U1D55_12680 [Phycisphaerae bacterium]